MWQPRNGQIIRDSQGKRNFLRLVDMFSKIKQISVKTETKEHIKLHLFYCKISTLLKNFHL